MKTTEVIYIIQTRVNPEEDSEDNWFDLMAGGEERFTDLDQAIETRDIENDKWKHRNVLPQFRIIVESVTFERFPL